VCKLWKARDYRLQISPVGGAPRRADANEVDSGSDVRIDARSDAPDDADASSDATTDSPIDAEADAPVDSEVLDTRADQGAG